MKKVGRLEPGGATQGAVEVVGVVVRDGLEGFQ
jgi:hypothetical protein